MIQSIDKSIYQLQYRPQPGGPRGKGYGRPPTRHQPQQSIREETEVIIEKEHKPNRGGGGYGRPPPKHHPHQPKPRINDDYINDSDETVEVNIKPETVAKEVIDDNDEIDDATDRGRQNNQKLDKLVIGGGRSNRPHPQKPKPNQLNRQQGGRPQPNNNDPCQTTDSLVGFCMPASYCYSQFSTLEEYRANICEFSENSPFNNGGGGICCPKDEPVLDAFDLPIRVPQIVKPSTKIQFISLEDINVAAKEAQAIIQREIEKERNLIQRGMVQRHGSMQSMHQAFFGEFDPVQFKLTKGGFLSLATTLIIKTK